MATIIPWDVPLQAKWYRATALTAIHFGGGKLALKLIEERVETMWQLSFGTVQAIRVTTEECASSILETLPKQGGFFEVQDWPWLKELGQGQVAFLEKARHFIVCCYDEVVEIIATDPCFVHLEDEHAVRDGSSA